MKQMNGKVDSPVSTSPLILRSFLLSLAVFCSMPLITAQPTNGLVAWYTFSGNASDGSGNGNHGSVNGAALTTDRFGNANSAYNFDGNNDYIEAGNMPAITSGLSFSIWINASSTQNSSLPVLIAYQNNSWGLLFEERNGASDIRLYNHSSWQWNCQTQMTFNPGNWQHFVVTWSSSSGLLSFFHNGSNVSECSGNNSQITGVNNGSEIKIGARGYGSKDGNIVEFFKGKLDDVRIYNRKLSSSEVQQLFNEGSSTPTCSDGIQNQGEAGIDCGGPCTACTINPTCSDGIQNQGEAGIDCGGPCPDCPTGGDGGLWSSSGSKIYYNTGNVGIGTTNPQARFTVDGAIMAKEVRVKTSVSSYPDYVFNSGYQLRTLQNLEAFIQRYRHLPDIPTAANVAKDGIYLGEMSKKLLQKIEELTLYTIEQQKEIEELRKQVRELEKKYRGIVPIPEGE